MARLSGVDTNNLRRDTGSGSPSRSGSGPTQDNKSTRLTELSGELCQTSGKTVAGNTPKPVTIDTRPLTKETAPILGQPAFVPIASREQPRIVTKSTPSIRSEQTVVTTTEALSVSFVCGSKSS